MPRITLYSFWRSSAAHRVRIALALKELSYEYVPVNLATGEQSGSAHSARSPTRLVPCLQIDGVPYVESMAIIELIDERFPTQPRLYPTDVHGRARARALAEIVNSGIQPLQNLRLLTSVSADADTQKRWQDLLAFEEKILPRGLGSLERALGVHAEEGVDGPYAYGAEVTVADLFLVPQVFAARRFGVDTRPYRRVMAAFEAASTLEAFRRAEPDNQPDARTS